MKGEAEVKVVLPGGIHPAHISFWGGPDTQKERLSFSTPILNSQGRISDWPNLGQTPTFISQGRGENVAVRRHPVLWFLKQKC